jgi:integrase
MPGKGNARVSVKKYLGVFYRERAELFNGRPDRTFEVCYQKGGRKIWKTVGRLSNGVTAKDAHEARLALLAAPPPPPARSHHSMLDSWLARRQPKNYTVASIAAVKRLLPDRPVGEVGPDDVAAFVRGLSAEGLSASTVKTYMFPLKAVLREASAHGLRSGLNPAHGESGLKLPKIDNKCERWLTPPEAAKLLAALEVSSPLWRDIAAFSLYTGARLGEIYRIKGRDVSPETMTCVLNGKSRKREAIPLCPEALEILQRRAGRPESPVFSETPGGPALSNSLPFAKAVKVCGFNDGVADKRHKVWFHTLRHTFASWLVQAGVDLYVVQRLLRHASPVMTQRYAHLRPDNLRAPLESVRAAMAGEAPPPVLEAPAPPTLLN